MMPPKPPSRPEKVSLWRYMRLFRDDILSAQPAKLYRAWMAEFKTPFFRSYMINDPSLIKRGKGSAGLLTLRLKAGACAIRSRRCGPQERHLSRV
jgi:hypothetical protein